MILKTICVLGGTGFVGHQLVSELTKSGYQVRVPSRNRERRLSLTVLPDVDVFDADIHDEAQLTQLFEGCDAVINLVAILNKQGKDTFQRNHVDLPRKIINACRANGITRLLHMSALNADAEKGSSEYLRSKGEGEALVRAAEDLNVTVFRPSIIFGRGDRFFNRFALMLNYLPVMPVFCPGALMAPVFIGDVVAVMSKSLNDSATHGQQYDLCGPDQFTFVELVEYTAKLTQAKTKILPLGDGLSALHGRVLGLLPMKIFTYDNYLSLQTPAVCEGEFPSQFDITPSRVDAIVPKYVGKKDIRGRYDAMRRVAARDPE